ncbi:MAG: signal peptide peptidase SppA [Acetobacteraceae bacterium]|nr:signal peptide peptidase SppA [Acetobacteraceae bacterium]
MSIETDLLMDRRRLKRRLFVWQVTAVLALLAAIGTAAGVWGIGGRQHIARINVTGIISDNRKLNQAIDALAKDTRVPAAILFINSPGGSVSGGEGLHDVLARLAAKKPLVAVMGGTAASAGYMIAMPAARIFARESTLTGSIGVLLETGEISGLLGKLGIETEAITSGPLKDQPSFTKPLSPEGRQVLNGLVMDMYEQFVAMVAAGRHLPPERVRALADGRAYTGRQALPLGLIDQFGGEPEARDWLAREKGVAADLPVEDVETGSLSQRTFGAVLGPMVGVFQKTLLEQGLTLDGLWALWHPSGN